MRGIIRLIALLAWGAVVLMVGGYATGHGTGQVTAGGLELLALVAGVAAVMATPVWGRSVRADRERARV